MALILPRTLRSRPSLQRRCDTCAGQIGDWPGSGSPLELVVSAESASNGSGWVRGSNPPAPYFISRAPGHEGAPSCGSFLSVVTAGACAGPAVPRCRADPARTGAAQHVPSMPSVAWLVLDGSLVGPVWMLG